MPLPIPLPPTSVILMHYAYDANTGLFTHKFPQRSRRIVGDRNIAGVLGLNGYISLYIEKRRYLAHRLAWKILYSVDPSEQVDHKNNIRHDNRACNLRLANWHEQARNATRSKNNTSGFKGVSWDNRKKVYRANIHFNKKTHFLGHFKNAQEAHAAYVAAATQHHKEFANAG